MAFCFCSVCEQLLCLYSPGRMNFLLCSLYLINTSFNTLVSLFLKHVGHRAGICACFLLQCSGASALCQRHQVLLVWVCPLSVSCSCPVSCVAPIFSSLLPLGLWAAWIPLYHFLLTSSVCFHPGAFPSTYPLQSLNRVIISDKIAVSGLSSAV